MDTNKCAHPACNCTVPKNGPFGKYCSEHCKEARDIIELQKAVRDLPVSDHVLKYAVRLVRATRPGDKRAPDWIKKWIHCGAGPRAAQNLIVGAKARAVTTSTVRFRFSARSLITSAGSFSWSTRFIRKRQRLVRESIR